MNDFQTGKVYFAEGIRRYAAVWAQLLRTLRAEGVEPALLPQTESRKHIWARDYMPVQLGAGRFLQYRYDPDYLKGYEGYIPPYEAICRELGLDCKRTELVIDGGNVVRCGDRVILTDKVLQENPRYSRGQLLRRLEEALEAEVCLIPWDRGERYGHADGMVRAIGPGEVLINNYGDLEPAFRGRLKAALEGAGLRVAELRYGLPHPSPHSWAYLNFLQVNNCIFVPGLDLPEDVLAVAQLQALYPRRHVVLVPACRPLVRLGGALNCVSWTVLADETEKPR